MDAAVSLTSVSKSYEGRAVVRGVSLDVERGEFFALLGPSGCGKSTTLRLVAGFEEADEGEVRVCGEVVTRAAPAFAGKVNMVFQNYALFPHLTVGENVAFGLRMAGMNRPDRERRARELLAMVRMEGQEGRLPGVLSGGQQQRVALARAMATRPEVVLLDEPLGALDAGLRRELQEELRQLHAAHGVTFVLVTHDQEEAMRLAGRLCLMRGGRVLQTGTPREVYERPVSRAAAEHLGECRFLSGSLTSDGGRRVVRGEAWELPVDEMAATGRVLVCVRPEAVRIGIAACGEAVGWVRLPDAEVAGVDYQGATMQARLRLPCGSELLAMCGGDAGEAAVRSVVPVRVRAEALRVLPVEEEGA